MRMPKLADMSVDALLSMRDSIEKQLGARASDMKRQLQSLGMLSREQPRKLGRKGPMKGGKVKPKYRGPNGETWAGRGAQPRWLTALIKEGHNREEFAVAGAATPRKAMPKKRGRKKNAA